MGEARVQRRFVLVLEHLGGRRRTEDRDDNDVLAVKVRAVVVVVANVCRFILMRVHINNGGAGRQRVADESGQCYTRVTDV